MPKLRASATARSRQTYARVVSKKPLTFLLLIRTSSLTKQTPRTGLEGEHLNPTLLLRPHARHYKVIPYRPEPSASAVSFGGGGFRLRGALLHPHYVFAARQYRKNAAVFCSDRRTQNQTFQAQKIKNPRHETEKCFGTVHFLRYKKAYLRKTSCKIQRNML